MPQQFPGLPSINYWIIGIVSGLILIMSVILHELCHSLMARKMGLPIKRITLFFLGGASELPEEPKSPGIEFKMALAGPLSSIAIGVLFGLMWFTFKNENFSTELLAITQYGALINIILGIFNLLPAYPMDGGRLLRSVLWKWKGNLINATKIASRTGVILSYLMIFSGVAIIVLGGSLGGLWIILIGWFIRNSAEAGLSQTIISKMLAETSVNEIMSKDIVTVDAEKSLEELVKDYFLVHKFGSYPVTKEDKITGFVNIDQVKEVSKSKWTDTNVDDIMRPLDSLTIITPDTPASDVMFKISQKDEGRFLVMDNDQIKGIISRKDLTSLIKTKLDLEQYE